MFVTGGRVREALGSTGVRGRDRFKNRANRGVNYGIPGIRDLVNENTGRIGERLSGQGSCQICARMRHWGKNGLVLTEARNAGFP